MLFFGLSQRRIVLCCCPFVFFIFFKFFIIPTFLCRVTTEGELAVMEGQSLTVPCHYDPQYAGYVKYWCRGKMREFCTSLARTDPAHPAARKVSIFDDPVQQVFTVTMGDLKETDSGWYMCGVEVGGVWNSRRCRLHVHQGMSVVNSRLSGEEGSSVTVECHYSERYRYISLPSP
uniref:Polymeric immunoglobulin receptor n=1 Tax=Cyclopterus lumpus TaxID=8103 RepID=A0A8C2XHZ1_CYCLU